MLRGSIPKWICAALGLVAGVVVLGLVALWPRSRSPALAEVLRMGESLPGLKTEEEFHAWDREHGAGFGKAITVSSAPDFLRALFETLGTGNARESLICAVAIGALDDKLYDQRAALQALAREYRPRVEVALRKRCAASWLEAEIYWGVLDLADRKPKSVRRSPRSTSGAQAPRPTTGWH